VPVEVVAAQTRALERTLKKVSFGFAVELRGGVGGEADGEESVIYIQMGFTCNKRQTMVSSMVLPDDAHLSKRSCVNCFTSTQKVMKLKVIWFNHELDAKCILNHH
jgi:hypothetical protein